MGYDPNEPRDDAGRWTTASGHNAGSGNRGITDHVVRQFYSDRVSQAGKFNFKRIRQDNTSARVAPLEVRDYMRGRLTRNEMRLARLGSSVTDPNLRLHRYNRNTKKKF
jgi:hypothetical protein